MSKSKVIIDRDLFVQMRSALALGYEVVSVNRFAGLDQNPKGIVDVLASASIAANVPKLATIEVREQGPILTLNEAQIAAKLVADKEELDAFVKLLVKYFVFDAKTDDADDKLMCQLFDVELGADADTIEMAVRHNAKQLLGLA